MSLIKGGTIMPGDPAISMRARLGSPALGSATAVMAAFTDNGKYLRFYNATTLWTGGEAKYITATFGGTAADIKAVQVEIVGTDAAGSPQTESLPAATVNTAGSVTSVAKFKTITQITIPAHDGTGATTSVGVSGGGAAAVLAAWTDVGVDARFKTATITNPVVPRNITATAGGTSGDVKAIQPIVVGTDQAGQSVSETLPAFTVNTTGIVAGSKAFKTITYLDLPPHDGNGATTAFGTGALLGLGERLSENTIQRAYLGGTVEGTAPTVAVDATNMSGNTITLNSALNGTAVIVDYLSNG